MAATSINAVRLKTDSFNSDASKRKPFAINILGFKVTN